MGQYWYLLNLDRRERAYGDKLGEWLPLGDYTWLEQRLRIPQLSLHIDRWIAHGKCARQRGSLLKLPNEVIDMVFTELRLEDSVSILCLAATCKELLLLGKPHVYQVMRRACQSWGYCRIICVGDYCYGIEDADLPPGLLTVEEKKAIEDMYGKEDRRSKLYGFAAATFSSDEIAFDSPLNSVLVCSPQFRRLLYSRSATEQHDLRMIRKLMTPAYEEGPTVLCNVSKGECVRRDALDLPGDISLGLVLLSQVCWSHDSSCSLRIDEDFAEKLVQGRWAGDRFCITTESTMPELPGGAEWKDVTREVHDLLCHLYYNEIAPDI